MRRSEHTRAHTKLSLTRSDMRYEILGVYIICAFHPVRKDKTKKGGGGDSTQGGAPSSRSQQRASTVKAKPINMMRRAAGRTGCTSAICARLVPRPGTGTSAARPRTLSTLVRQRRDEQQSIIVRAAARRSRLQQLRQQQHKQQPHLLWRQGVCGKWSNASASRSTTAVSGGPAVASRSFSTGERGQGHFCTHLFLVRTTSTLPEYSVVTEEDHAVVRAI